MRSFGAMVVGGVASLVILKILMAMVFPLFGFMFGLVGIALKILFWGAIAYFVWRLLKGSRRPHAEG